MLIGRKFSGGHLDSNVFRTCICHFSTSLTIEYRSGESDGSSAKVNNKYINTINIIGNELKEITTRCICTTSKLSIDYIKTDIYTPYNMEALNFY